MRPTAEGSTMSRQAMMMSRGKRVFFPAAAAQVDRQFAVFATPPPPASSGNGAFRGELESAAAARCRFWWGKQLWQAWLAPANRLFREPLRSALDYGPAVWKWLQSTRADGSDPVPRRSLCLVPLPLELLIQRRLSIAHRSALQRRLYETKNEREHKVNAKGVGKVRVKGEAKWRPSWDKRSNLWAASADIPATLPAVSA